MKLILAFLTTMFVIPSTFAMGSRSPNRELSREDKELLDYAKGMLRYENVRIWQVGMKETEVTGPEEFVKSKKGMYYTGRLIIRRWGENMDTDLDTYAWNSSAGERWHVMREVIYYDHEVRAYSRGYQGPRPISEWERAGDFMEEFIGEEPDWSVFK